MGLGVEEGEILVGVVAGLIDPARVEEGHQRRLVGGELVLAREAGAGPEALADLGVVGAGGGVKEARRVPNRGRGRLPIGPTGVGPIANRPYRRQSPFAPPPPAVYKYYSEGGRPY